MNDELTQESVLTKLKQKEKIIIAAAAGIIVVILLILVIVLSQQTATNQQGQSTQQTPTKQISEESAKNEMTNYVQRMLLPQYRSSLKASKYTSQENTILGLQTFSATWEKQQTLFLTSVTYGGTDSIVVGNDLSLFIPNTIASISAQTASAVLSGYFLTAPQGSWNCQQITLLAIPVTICENQWMNKNNGEKFGMGIVSYVPQIGRAQLFTCSRMFGNPLFDSTSCSGYKISYDEEQQKTQAGTTPTPNASIPRNPVKGAPVIPPLE